MHKYVINNESKNTSGFLVSMILTLIFSAGIGALSSVAEGYMIFFAILLLKIGICIVNIKYKARFSISYCYFILDALLVFLMSYYLGILSFGFVLALLSLFALCGILIKCNN